jgi:hypothetical protein
LPSKDSDLALNTSVYVAGWGSIQNYSLVGDQPEPDYPSILQNVKITILPEKDCDSSSIGGVQIIEELQICAGKIKIIKLILNCKSNKFFNFKGNLKGNKDTCQGKKFSKSVVDC